MPLMPVVPPDNLCPHLRTQPAKGRPVNLDETAAEFSRLSSLISDGLKAMRVQAVKLAESENVYRKAKAQAWVQCPNDPPGTKQADREWTSARREAWVDAETADLRQERDIADGMARAAYQAVRARQTQLSALQTLLNAHQQELKLANYGPEVAA